MTFISTCGHGYLKITLNQLIKAMKRGFQPTSYSFQFGNSVYLEEDCDFSEFLKTMTEINPAEIKSIYQDDIQKNRYNTIPLTLDDANERLTALSTYDHVPYGSIITAFGKEYTVLGYAQKKLIACNENGDRWTFPKNIITKIVCA
jgi:hypothetical protein